MTDLLVLAAALGVLLLVLLLTWALVWLPEQRRHHRATEMAGEHAGLSLSRGLGPFPRPPFRLFRRGTDQEIPRTVHGTLDGRPCRVLDLVYVRETPGVSHAWDEWWLVAEASKRFTYLVSRRHLTCAVVELPGADWPELIVDARGAAASRDAEHVRSRSVRLESEEFNRVFDVACDDPRFASHVLDARMMGLLLSMCRDRDVLVGRGQLVVVAESLEPARWPDLQRLANLAADRLPDVAFSVFGGERPAVTRTTGAATATD